MSGLPAGVDEIDRPRRPLLGWTAAVAAAVVVVDQVTKTLAVDRLSDGMVPIVWTLRLNLAFNSGLSFGQGRGLTTYITVLGVVLVVVLVVWSRHLVQPTMALAVALVIGGASGNLADRLFRDHGGAVVDFIDLQWWPVFNVADMAVSTGAALLILSTLRHPGEE